MISRPLTIVSGLFLVSGALALVGWVAGVVFKSHVVFDLQILNLWIGRWLMNRDPRGRSAAVLVLIVSIALSPIALVIVAVMDIVPTVNIYGVVVGTSWAVVAPYVVASTALSAWQVHVLRRPEIRALFHSAMEPVAPIT